MTDLILPLWPIARDVLAFLWSVLPRTVTEALLWQFIYLPLLLAAVYPVVIQYERGRWWKLLMPFTLVAAIVDVWLNFTTFSVYLGGLPEEGETTLSKRCKRLVRDSGWRGFIARLIARYTNLFDENHIPLP
ncbi:hypothetical protein [Hydrogenophaga sp.]|uniref:hypothetical protein n=1 Tax=Hydrogenophaga sp. TaxID=1904254 RepID=UPI003D136C43